MADIRHFVEISASPSKVYDAVTTDRGLAHWWTRTVTAKPEEGSTARFDFDNGYYKEMKIINLEKDKKVEWKCVTGQDEWINTTITFDLQDAGGKTILRFAHDGWKNETDMYAICNHHWGRFLQGLKSYCEGGEGQPHPGK